MGMGACGRYFSPDVLERIQATVNADPSISRGALSRRACEWIEWVTPNGRLQEMSCRKALLRLDGRGVIALPECAIGFSFQQQTRRTADVLPEFAPVRCRPADLGEVEVVPVSSRYCRVTLRPPQKGKLPPVTVWAVYAREQEPGPDVKAPLEWMFLTTVETNSFGEACERIGRRGIEVYYRTLKSGCRIEDRRLDNAARLEACLAIDMVVAWRIYMLTKQGRETPDIPCDVYLSEEEWQRAARTKPDDP